MRLEAIYDKGRLEFMQPVRFVKDRIKVIVEVSEHEVAGSKFPGVKKQETEYIRELLSRLDQIRKAPLPEDADKPQVTQKQIERFEAFALREDR